MSLFPFRDSAEKIDHRLIRFPSLRSEARESGTEVRVAVEGHLGIDFPGEESLTQRAPGNETDPKFLDGRQHFRFRISRPQRIFVLDGSEDWTVWARRMVLALASERPKCRTLPS